MITVEKYSHVSLAHKMVTKIQKLNNIEEDIEIVFDFDTKDAGYYYSNDYKLYINPFKRLDYCYGHPSGHDIRNIIFHEYGHYLDGKFNIAKPYRSYVRKKGHLYLCDHSKKNIGEEIAEIISLYISNPLLLKMMDKERFEFYQSYIKIPKSFLKDPYIIQLGWSKHFDKLLKKNFNIVL